MRDQDGALPDGRPVVHLPNQWFVAAPSAALRDRPVACTIQSTPLVLFRAGGGAPAALVDRCPHRNAPLSAGRVVRGELECGYHGWRFDGDGACRAIPGLCGPPDRHGRRATAHPAVDQDGFVWVYSTPAAVADTRPPRLPLLADRRYVTIRRSITFRAPLFHVLENALDVPHTAFLHAGLFRSDRKAHTIEVVVRRFADRAEAEFRGEPRPAGLVGRLLAPGGGVVEHVDRFLLPSIAQVEYRLGPANHLVVTTAMTPVDESTTRLFAVISLRLRLPARLVALFVAPLAGRILRQDRAILGRQTDTIRRFGGEDLASTEIDVLGPQIWRLLCDAARGERGGEGLLHEHRVGLRV